MTVLYPILLALYRQSTLDALQMILIASFSIVETTAYATVRAVFEFAQRTAPSRTILFVRAYHLIYLSVLMQVGVSWSNLVLMTTIDFVMNFFTKIRPLRRLLRQLRHSGNDAKQHKLKKEALLLAECLVMEEFMEVAVPVVFMVVSLFFFVHPNAKFSTILDAGYLKWSHLSRSLSSLAVYSFAEVVGLRLQIYFTLPAQDLQQLPPLRVIAGFCIQRDRWLMISMIGIFSGITLVQTLAHAGFDWTFEFAWLNH